MSEPTERDIVMAAKFLDCEREAAIPLARLLAAAREEGAQVAHQLWLSGALPAKASENEPS